MKIAILFVLFNFLFLHASSELIVANTDIAERSINFIIFACLVWYLVAGKLKAALSDRQQGISKRLNEAQDKIKQAQVKKDSVEIRLNEAKIQAQEIVASAKKEILTLVKHIEDKNKEHIEHLIKSNEVAMDFERRKMKKSVVLEILQETFERDSLKFSSENYLNILDKKAA